MINKNVFLVSVIFIAILSRFIPHPPNFTPIAAIALLSSKGFNNRWVTLAIPIISLFISDLFLGLHATIPFVYGAFVLIALLGMTAKKISVGSVLLSSTIFFLVSNFGVWLVGYPITIDGLISCYTLAIPFFLNTILGDLVYSAVLIYPFYALQKKNLITA
tara:strand:+ start:10688 stop:11170 length:483 start_codon:yes stop_codon:yes gene_type:complete